MPHKHTRREKDLSTFDLPPTQIAKPLPVTSISRKSANNAKSKPAQAQQTQSQKCSKRKRGSDVKDDAPRAFKRLMAIASGKKVRSGLDDGSRPASKKQNKTVKAMPKGDVAAAKDTAEAPSIRPGEKLSDFAARVDAALPLQGLINKPIKNGQDPLGLKVYRTKKERKMHKLYEEWREEERKIKDRKEEDLEAAEEKAMEEEELDIKWRADLHGGSSAATTGNRKKKKRKRARLLGEAVDKEDDPWGELKRKRGEERIGLHDVAQAPPELPKLTGKKFTVRGAAVEVDGIPKAAGSLRRREELQGVRNEVVASYRKMMEKKRLNMAAGTS